MRLHKNKEKDFLHKLVTFCFLKVFNEQKVFYQNNLIVILMTIMYSSYTINL